MTKLIPILLTEDEVAIAVAALIKVEEIAERSQNKMNARAVRLALQYHADRALSAERELAAINLFDLNKGGLTDIALLDATRNPIAEIAGMARGEIARRSNAGLWSL